MSKFIRNVAVFLGIFLFASCSLSELSSGSQSKTDTSIPKEHSSNEGKDCCFSTSLEFIGVEPVLEMKYDSNAKKLSEEMLRYAFAEFEEINKKECECNISLINICGDDNFEMILSLRTAGNIESSYILTADNNTPVCIGAFEHSMEFGGIYANSTDNAYYIVCSGFHSNKESLNWLTVNKLDVSMINMSSPDLAEYQNDDALDFIYDTHMYFIRYDNEDWDSEKQTWKSPEETASLFYCEDTGLYEAYSVSKRILELTSIEIGDIINGDGNLIYAYLPGENYIVSRQEYEQIKAKIFDVLIEVNDEPEIASGWINVDDIDKWIESLA